MAAAAFASQGAKRDANSESNVSLFCWMNGRVIREGGHTAVACLPLGGCPSTQADRE